MLIRQVLTVVICICLSLITQPLPVFAEDAVYKPPVVGAPMRRVGGGTRSADAFQPLVRGAPSRRIGGGTRSVGSDIALQSEFVLAVLSPEHTGETTEASPTLYWFLSHPINQPVKFTLTQDFSNMAVDTSNSEEDFDYAPLLELDIPNPTDGIHAVDLAKHNITLKSGVVYQWSVSISDNGIFSTATLLRIQDATRLASVKKAIEQSSAAQQPGTYAQNGVWYDALMSLGKLLAKATPTQVMQYREQRAKLLDQVGLPQAATYERSPEQS